MARNIQLRRSPALTANHWHLRVFRVRIEVLAVEDDAPRHVFVHRRRPADPHTGIAEDEFCTIATPVHLAEYPVGDPDPNVPFPFFRKDFMEVDVRSQTEYDELWAEIQNAVCNILDILQFLDDLVLRDTAQCGDTFALYTLTTDQLFTLSAAEFSHLTLFESDFQRELRLLKQGALGFGLTLERLGTKNTNFWHLTVWRMRVRIGTLLGGMSEHIFVYERQPPDPATGEIFDVFQGVASPIDLTGLPKDNPVAGSPFFLSTQLEVDLPSQKEHDEMWEALVLDVCNLVDVLNGEDRGEVVEWCRDRPVSESLSESLSTSI